MVNKVILVGNLGADPITSRLPTGTVITNMSLATSERRKNSDGDVIEQTQWHRLVAFSTTAEYCEKFKKGQKLYIEGKIRSRKYTVKATGEEKWITEIFVETVKNLTPRYISEAREKSRKEQVQTPISEPVH